MYIKLRAFDFIEKQKKSKARYLSYGVLENRKIIEKLLFVENFVQNE